MDMVSLNAFVRKLQAPSCIKTIVVEPSLVSDQLVGLHVLQHLLLDCLYPRDHGSGVE